MWRSALFRRKEEEEEEETEERSKDELRTRKVKIDVTGGTGRAGEGEWRMKWML